MTHYLIRIIMTLLACDSYNLNYYRPFSSSADPPAPSLPGVAGGGGGTRGGGGDDY
jgi:hypothetical protein